MFLCLKFGRKVHFENSYFLWILERSDAKPGHFRESQVVMSMNRQKDYICTCPGPFLLYLHCNQRDGQKAKSICKQESRRRYDIGETEVVIHLIEIMTIS